MKKKEYILPISEVMILSPQNRIMKNFDYSGAPNPAPAPERRAPAF